MKLCKHLEPILNNELNNGNSIKEINEDAWTNAVLVVNLKNVINTSFVNEEIQKNDSIQCFEINDNHYETQNVYYCIACKHAIAGPK